VNPVETIQLALSAIFRNRLRSSLTILGIVIGVFSVILLVALVSGLQSFITGQISGLGSNLIFVIPGNISGPRSPGGVVTNRLLFSDAKDLKNKLAKDAEISPAIQKTNTIKFGNKQSKNASVLGVEGNYDKIIQALKITEGRFLNSSDTAAGKRVAVVGPTVAANLFSAKSAVGQTIQIGNLKYTVIGTLGPRGSVFGMDQDNVAIIPLQAARQQFGITNPNTIYISVNHVEDIKRVQDQVKKILSKRLSEDDFSVQNQEQTLSTISQITGVLTIALGGIAAISLLVGGIGVMNIMLVSVTERTREIGLRKALGAKSKDIRNQFLIEAVTLSAVGGIIGILLGMLVALLINQFFITTTVTLWSVALSFGFSMLVGIIFGVTPAIRAAKLDPIQALRYE
jgi:putative ABC transport system permease protein